MADDGEREAKRVFKILVCDLESKCNLPAAVRKLGVPGIDFFRKHPQYFIIFEDDLGEPCMVGARNKLFKLCWPYARRGRCEELACGKVHLCLDHASGHCKLSAECERKHHFQCEHNKQILKTLELVSFPEECLLSLLRMCTAQVCTWYNQREICPNRDACIRFHVCMNHVRSGCRRGEDCTRSHTFDTTHSKRLLKQYGLDDKGSREILDNVMIYRNKPRARDPDELLMRTLRDLITSSKEPDDMNELLSGATGTDLGLPLLSARQNRHPQPAEDDPNDELAMIQRALGVDDLTDILIYQLEVDSQNSPTEKEATKVDLAEEQCCEAKIDEEIDQIQTYQTGMVPDAMTRREPLMTFTDIAPQDDKTYICGPALVGECPSDIKRCRDAHYMNRYLWQVKVKDKWYNLNTVNEDIEQSYVRKDREYTTMMPIEVPDISGDLITIQFPRMRAVLETNALMVYQIRRLSVRHENIVPGKRDAALPFPGALLPPRKRTGARPKIPIKVVDSDSSEDSDGHGQGHVRHDMNVKLHLIRAKRLQVLTDNHSKQPDHLTENVTKFHTAMADLPLAIKLPNVHSREKISKEWSDAQTYVWQVMLDKKWFDLSDANEEIEAAYEKDEVDYLTMLPCRDDTDVPKLIEINFENMYAVSQDTMELLRVVRIARPPSSQRPDDAVFEIKQDLATQEVDIVSAQTRVKQDLVTPDADTVSAASGDLKGNKSNTDGISDDSDEEDEEDGEDKHPNIIHEWQWSADAETWIAHEKDVSDCLEGAFKSGKASGKMKINGDKVKVNFKEMTQTSNSSGDINIVFIRRLPKPSSD